MLAVVSASLPRELLGRASFGPEELNTIAEAFDQAWAAIAGNFAENALTVEAARMKLANAILAEARAKRVTDAETLKNAALQALARSYRSGI
jgi:hypothetical protein